MPIVPSYGNQKFQDTAIPVPQISAAPVVDAFGATANSSRAVEAAGSRLVSEGRRIADEALQKANQLAVLHADTELSALETNLQYDPKIGAMNVKGKNAFGLPDTVKKNWDDGVKTISKDLKNEDQRRSFNQMVGSRWASLDKNIQHHVSTEIKNYDNEVTNSYIANERNAAVSNFNDPVRIGLAVDRQKAAIIDFAQRNGQPEEWVKEKIGEVSSKTHVGVIDRMLANDQDIAAKAYYDANKDEIGGPDSANLDKALEEGSLRGESQRRVDSIMNAGMDRTEALAEIQKIDDPKLRDAVNDRVNQAFSQRRAAEVQDREDLYDGAANLLDSGPRGAPARSVIPPGTWTKLSLEQKNALERRSENPPNNSKRWLDFLALTPEEIGSMSRAKFETEYWSTFDAEHRTRAEAQWNAAQGGNTQNNAKLSSTRSYDDIVRSTLKSTGLVDTSVPLKKLSDEKANLWDQFDREASREIHDFETNQLGGKRASTVEEKQKIVDRIAIQKVFVDKPWARDPEKPAALVTSDERGRVYVPIKQIPAPALLALKSEAERLRIRADKDSLERAYAALLTGERDDNKIRDILKGTE